MTRFDLLFCGRRHKALVISPPPTPRIRRLIVHKRDFAPRFKVRARLAARVCEMAARGAVG